MINLEMLCSFKGIFYTDSSLSMSYYSAEDGESTSHNIGGKELLL